MNKSVLFGVVLMLTWASAANADTTVTVQPGDRLVDLLRGGGITLGQLKDANPGKIPSVCRSTKTVVGRFGAFTLCLRPRSYLVAGRTLTIPDSRAAVEARAGQVEGLRRTISERDVTIRDLNDQLRAQQETQATSSNPQHSDEMGKVLAEVTSLKRLRASEIASLKQRHGREIASARAEAKRLRATITRERGQHSRAEEELEKALRAAKREGATARVVVKRVPTSSYRSLATGLGIGLALFALVALVLGVDRRRKSRTIGQLERDKRNALRDAQNQREGKDGLQQILENEQSLRKLTTSDKETKLTARISELEKTGKQSEEARLVLETENSKIRQQLETASSRADGFQKLVAKSEANNTAEIASLREHLTVELRQQIMDEVRPAIEVEAAAKSKAEIEDLRATVMRLRDELDARGRRPTQERERSAEELALTTKKAADDIESATKRVKEEYEGQFSDLQKQLSDKEIEAARLSERVESLEGELAQNRKLRQEQSGFEQRLYNATEQLEKQRSEIAEIQRTNVDLNAQLDILRAERDAARKEASEAAASDQAVLDSLRSLENLRQGQAEWAQKEQKFEARFQNLQAKHSADLEAVRKGIRAEFQEKHDRMKASYDAKIEELRSELEGIKAAQPRPATPDVRPRVKVSTPPLPIPAPRPVVEPEEHLDDSDLEALRVRESSTALEPFQPPAVAARTDIFREPTAIRRNPLVEGLEDAVERADTFPLDSGTAIEGFSGGKPTVEDALPERERIPTVPGRRVPPKGFTFWPKDPGGKLICQLGCEDPVDFNDAAITAHRAFHAEVDEESGTLPIPPRGGNGADHHALHSDELKPHKAKPKKYKTGGVELFECPCGASNFDKDGWNEHEARGHLECYFCNPPVVIQSDQLKRHLGRFHPELVGKDKPRQT